MEFDNKEKKKAEGLNQTVNHFYRNINQSQIQQGTVISSQTISFKNKDGEMKELLTKLKKNYKDLKLKEDELKETKENIMELK